MKIRINMWLTFAMRLALGVVFILSSYAKLQHPELFTDTVIGYGLLPESLARSFGVALPWMELFVGCALLLGIFCRIAAIFSILIITTFIAANINAISHPYIGDTCQCFGTLVSLSHPVSLGVDAVMMFMAGWLLLQDDNSQFMSIGYLLRLVNPSIGKRQQFLFEKIIGLIGVILLMSIIIW